MTTTFNLNSFRIKVLEEFSKVIANRSDVNPRFLTDVIMIFKVFAITLGKVVNFSLNAKGLIVNLRFVRNSFLLIVILFLFKTTHAQVEPGVRAPAGVLPMKGD